MRRLCFEVLAAACASALPFDLAHSELQVCSGGVCEVERSAANEVRRLVATHKATHVEAVIARSYAGHEWEGLFPSPLSGIHCTASKCTLPLGDAYTYKLLRATVTPPAGTAHTTARLLSQGTFGVRKADIDAFSAAGGDDADASAAWFDAQVAAPPTLAQAYTRARQNPRHNSKTVGATYKPCGKGARYHAYAFATRDVGQALRVSKSNGVFVLKLSGVALTEVAEWAPGTGTFEICTVAEAFGDDGGVGVAAAGKCKNDAVRVPNPPVAFADSSGIVSVEADAVHVLTMRQMTFVLKRDQPSCTAFENADAVNAADLHFIKLGGAVHRYDRRLKLFANTPEAPSTEDAGEVSPGLCPAAAPTFMNAWQCRRGASPCAAAACGARGEAANDPTLGNRYTFLAKTQIDQVETVQNLDWPQALNDAKMLPFHNMALTADDQLRLRVAWALVQIIPVAEDGGGRLKDHSAYQQYLDTFIANAFGNFRDILQEVAYSPIMGKYLSFRGNRGYASGKTLPDQNFAREIMQLFTIGLWRLNPDGSEVLEGGEHVQTYDTRDIVTFARVWTGFFEQAHRGNIETQYENYVDPMRIDPQHRDTLPKTDLLGGYLGDGYPLCADLPPQHFLKRGAKYVYHGVESIEGEAYDGFSGTASEDLTPEGVTITVKSPAECMAWTHCGGADKAEHQAKFRVGVAEATGKEDIARDAAEKYLHGSNGEVLRVYGTVQLRDWSNDAAPTQMQITPFPENTDEADAYTAFVTQFNAKFPVGTQITVHNTAVKGRAPDALGQYTAAAGSELYTALCGGNGFDDKCTLPLHVMLSRALSCEDDTCRQVDDLTTVRIVVNDQAHYYTYVRPQCVKLAFFDGKLTGSQGWRGGIGKTAQCSDPAVPVAGAACCHKTVAGGSGQLAAAHKPPQCALLGERMRYATAAARCAAQGMVVCDGSLGPYDFTTACGASQQTWTDGSCGFEVEINGDGLINLISPTDKASGTWDTRFLNDTENTFYPRWGSEGFPTEASGDITADAWCVKTEAGKLHCSAQVADRPVFTSVPTRVDVEKRARIGAFNPVVTLAGYVCADGASCEAGADVVVYVKEGASIDTHAIIGLKREPARGGGYAWFMNRESYVIVGGHHTLRNPPAFMPLSGERPPSTKVAATYRPYLLYAEQSAHHETGALLDHLFYHPNTAPFLVKLLIQRFITSNPSPRYVTAVATAFSTGKAENGRGSGRTVAAFIIFSCNTLLHTFRYGDLHATIAEIMLDREARSSVLDADPGFGATREPFLKVLQVLRSLEMQTSHGQEVVMPHLMRWIGEDVFMTMSVFGFYLPNHMPKGPLGDRGLVSPETELSIPPRLFGLLNGLSGLVKNGLTSCDDGFGYYVPGIPGERRRNCKDDRAEGHLTFDAVAGAPEGPGGFPDEAVGSHIIDQLDMVLTDGRLSPASKQSILKGMPLYTQATLDQGIDLSACRDWAGFELVDECDCSAGAACDKGDVCKRASDGWSEAPRGCVKVQGKPYRAMAGNVSQPCCSAPEAEAAMEAAVKAAMEIILVAPEFHTTNLRGATGGSRAVPPAPPADGDNGYKAVVTVILEGGADSYNFLIPGTCTAPLSYEQYVATRGVVALPQSELVAVETIPNGQPCSKFFLQKNLTNVAAMYEAGDAAFFANVGNLVEPVTAATKKTARLPPFLFAHNTQRREIQSMHPQMSSAAGVMGRMADALPGRSKLYTMDRYYKIVEAEQSSATVLDLNDGVTRMQGYDQYRSSIDALAGGTAGSYFAETFGEDLQESLAVTEDLGERLRLFSEEEDGFGETRAGKQFRRVAQILRLRDSAGKRLADREMFALRLGGYDTHSEAYEESTQNLDRALLAFKEAMVTQGMWEDVVVVVISDFGRTLSSNGQGTDHGWGGNYFAVGGSVRDHTFLGEYPWTFDKEHPQQFGHGIMIPGIPYEAMWAPIMDWVGVPEARHAAVLPNINNFPDLQKSKAVLFDTNDTDGAEANGIGSSSSSDNNAAIIAGCVVGGFVVVGGVVFMMLRPRGSTIVPRDHTQLESPAASPGQEMGGQPHDANLPPPAAVE